jgi:hypothetical protein
VKRDPKERFHTQFAGQASHWTASSGPPWRYKERASSPVKICIAATTPVARNSHPTRLPGCRETASAPITAHEPKRTIIAALKPTMSKLIARSAPPAASIASPAAASDQASQDALRVLISLSRDRRNRARHDRHGRLVSDFYGLACTHTRRAGNQGARVVPYVSMVCLPPPVDPACRDQAREAMTELAAENLRPR